MLIHVAEICQSQLEKDMIFARYGGEEFVLGLKGRSAFDGERIANQLRKKVESHPLHAPEGNISVTISSGVAETTEKGNETLYQLLNKADKALYNAKEAGRNQVRVFEDLETSIK